MAGTSSMSKSDQVKLIAAIAALLVGAGLIAWNFGAFDRIFASKPEDPNSKLTDSQKQEAKKQQERAKKQELIAPPSGS